MPVQITAASAWSRYAGLSPVEKGVMRLKALMGTATTKTDFFTLVKATPLRSPDRKAWTLRALTIVMDGLHDHGLLDQNFACIEPLCHPIAVEALAAAEGPALAEAVYRASQPDRRFGGIYAYYQKPAESDVFRTLRLALYQNDEAAYLKLCDAYDKDFNPHNRHERLEALFAPIPIELDWLLSRTPALQAVIVTAKLGRFVASGDPDPALAPILDHYRALAEAAIPEALAAAVRRADLLAGRLPQLAAALEGKDDPTSSSLRALQGSVAFLSGRTQAALALYRDALKLIRKATGKRKIFLDGADGVFFLLALLNTGDPTLHPEIQAGLESVTRQRDPYALAFHSIQAVLSLKQGQDAKARAMVESVRSLRPHRPLAGACHALAEFLVDPALAIAHQADTMAWFDRLKDTLPLLARIHAEILARISLRPDAYERYLAVTGGAAAIEFLDLIKVEKPWERAFDHLATLIRGKPGAASPAVRKARRLIWLLNPEDKTLQVLEQQARGAEGWTLGRSVALKRLRDGDPRIDYLTDQDRRALRALTRDPEGWGDPDAYVIDPDQALPALVGHPAVFDARDRDRPLELVSYPAELIVTERRDGYRFTLSHHAPMPTVFLEPETPGRYRVIDITPRLVELQEILGKTGLSVPKAARDRVVALAREQAPTLPIRAEIAGVDLPAQAGVTVPVFQLRPQEDGLRAGLVVRPFGPGGPAYLPGQGGRSVLAPIDGRQQRVARDLDGERAAAAAVIAACPTLVRLGSEGPEWLTADLESSLELMLEFQACPHPLAIEWPQGKPIQIAPPADAKQMRLKLSRDGDWFRLSGTVEIDEDLVLDMDDLLRRLDRAPGRFVALDDGRFLALTREFRKQLDRLRGVSQADKTGRRLHRLGSLAVQDLLDGAGKLTADKAWRDFTQRLDAAGRHQPVVPPTLQADLRDYQVEGFAWLSRLAHWGAGACLADDMGLGKTVQAIALILEQAAHGPILVVAPTSVCHNWENEFARFAPTLEIRRLAEAADRAALIDGLGPGQVLIATYGLLPLEAEALAARSWRLVVFDEAQALKNAETKRAQASRTLQADLRVALTGTPIENDLDEIWSLFNTINPGLLGSRDSFQKRFVVPMERDRDPAARDALRALIRPFILRRTKSAVLAELPPRTDVVIDIELAAEERAFYEALRRKALEAIARLNTDQSGQRKLHILAEITRLRRACCHPGLIDPDTPLSGAKRDAFLDLVDELIRNRHKALVFSQFTGHLDGIRQALDAKGVSYQYLDGATPAAQRQQRVAAFQGGTGDLFLISLKAGGTGLNLTAADYVIHLDPWWNPAVEDQASDRAHRIGQQRPVTVYRLIVRDSIEEQILRLHRSKRDLAADLLEGTEMSAKLTEDELIGLIRA